MKQDFSKQELSDQSIQDIKIEILPDCEILDLSLNKFENVFVKDFNWFLEKQTTKQLNFIGNNSCYLQNQLLELSLDCLKKVLWLNGTFLDSPDCYRQFYLPKIPKVDFQSIIESHENYYKETQGELVLKRATQVKPHLNDLVDSAFRGKAFSCSIIADHFYLVASETKNKYKKIEYLKLSLDWIELSILRGSGLNKLQRNILFKEIKELET